MSSIRIDKKNTAGMLQIARTNHEASQVLIENFKFAWSTN